MDIPTPHIEAKRKDDFAKTVIMPGDPKRAEWIAKNFLTNVKLVNSIRGILGFTGMYNKKNVSVMASGMGNPSMGIYSHELFKFYDVDKIIRIGTCGTYEKDLNLGDIILCEKSITNTNYCNLYKDNITQIPSSKALLDQVVKIAKKENIKFSVGPIFCTDTFYAEADEEKFIKENKCLGTEMESASLYYNAKTLNKQALAICSVSDNLTTGQKMSSEDREQNLGKMVKLALELV